MAEGDADRAQGADDGTTSPGALPEGTIREIDRWFVTRGVPHFIESDIEGSALDTWTRALNLLIAAYLLLCLNALDLRNWTLAQNLLGAVAGVGIGVAAWAISNRLRGRPTFARPRSIDSPELAVFLIGPVLPALLFGQPGDALESFLIGVALLALIYVWSAYGVGAMIRWGGKEGLGQLGQLTALLARGLPLLLIFNTFLFVNAEVWEVAGTLGGTTYLVVIGTFFLLGALFALSRVPAFVKELNEFESWDRITRNVRKTPAAAVELPDTGRPHDPLTWRQRLNIGLMVLFGQAVQITLVVAGVIGFFVGFGFMTMSESTILNWTRLTELDVLATAELDGRELVLTESLLRVSVFLGFFSGMYFTVLLATDPTYQAAITDRVRPQIREALAVRTAYRVARGTHRADDEPDGVVT